MYKFINQSKKMIVFIYKFNGALNAITTINTGTYLLVQFNTAHP